MFGKNVQKSPNFWQKCLKITKFLAKMFKIAKFLAKIVLKL
jgi:hypothetical protein